MDLIYLDYNCFQRGFDDSRQIKIQLEALACEEIFAKTEGKDIRLVWSFMHEDENILCPFIERKIEVWRLSVLCKLRLGRIRKYIASLKNFSKMQIYPLKTLYIWHVPVMQNADFF